jgi:para-nitrobenzyl esterase
MGAGAGLALGLGVLGSASAAGHGDPVVMTRHGPVTGLREGGVLAFRGVRYGQDTARTRFARPMAPESWRDPVRAVAYGAASPQRGGEPNQSEDCLFLNVWTPSAEAGARRPVMVYIHGGAYNSGSGSDPQTNGARLALAADVVVVTLNHRLNVFGYLSLSRVFSGVFPDSGNAGQWDLVLALEWVRNSIAQFGGDPARVMLFGQSGGGAKIATLMASPAAAGLFHAVATMSGQQVTASGPLNAERRARAYLGALQVATPEALLALPVERLLEALGEVRDPVNPEFGLYVGPVLDGRMLMRHPFWPDAPELSRHIPMILGNTAGETRNLIGGAEPESFSLTWEDVPARLARHMRCDIDPDLVVAHYRTAHPAMSPSEVFFAATTAARSWRGQVEEADARARQGAPTWVYRFDLASPRDGGKWGAPHTVDIAAVFGNLGAPGAWLGQGATARAVSDTLQRAFVALARTGDPNTAGLPDWPQYGLARRQTLILDAVTRVEDDPRGAERALFATVPFIQWGS